MLRIDDLLSHSARSVTNRKSQKMRNSFTATGHPVQDVPDWLAALWRDMTSHISGLVASTHLKNMQICFGIMKIENLWNHHWLDSHLPAIQLWSVCNACVRIRICLQTIYILTSADWGFHKVNDQASNMGHNDLVFSIRITKILRGMPTLEKWLCLIRVPKIISGWSWLIIMSNSH